MPTQHVLLTIDEAAEQLGIKRTFCYKLITEGRLRSVKVGKLRRVPAVDLADYVEQLRESAD